MKQVHLQSVDYRPQCVHPRTTWQFCCSRVRGSWMDGWLVRGEMDKCMEWMICWSVGRSIDRLIDMIWCLNKWIHIVIGLIALLVAGSVAQWLSRRTPVCVIPCSNPHWTNGGRYFACLITNMCAQGSWPMQIGK